MVKLRALGESFMLFMIICGNQLVISEELCTSEPNECDCQVNSGLVSLDCIGKELTSFPNIFAVQSAVHSIDVTNNQLNVFPKFNESVPLLTTLDLTDNMIHQIPENALSFLPSLRFLYINNNHIANWADIRPNTVLQFAPNLETLSLSGNLLTSLTSIDQSFVLTSHSLKILDLSDCKITKVTGQFVLQGLPKLEHLILSGNPLRSISDIVSNNLLSLDLSNCKLTFLQPTVFVRLPSLTYVNLSRNQRLSLTRKAEEFVQSESLKRIDLSLCNMDGIELTGFPNLMTAILRGNLISRIKRESFEKNVGLENIDLSSNSITHISSTSFRELKLLKHLDLSYNMIRRIERDTFKDNDVLTSINLSRNYVERFNRIIARSLTHLNMSWCEVLNIDLDAFNDLPELVELDLSNNLFSEFPASLQSQTLQTLDLSMCRLSTSRNNTFQGFPELSGINLAGNRFTTMFRADFFAENMYLRDIWMGDNPWRCECKDKYSYEFFIYLNDHPAKLNDYTQLRCHSPDEFYGLTWDVACADIWYAENRQAIGTAQKVWTFLMVGIVILSAAVCLMMSVKRCIDGRKRSRLEEERLQNLEESREIMRRNRVILDQEAQLNAPDPRESRPPCYEDAILLPRLNGSFASLRKIKSDDEDDEVDSHISRRNRSRSEEVLSPRESSLDQNRLTRRQIIAEANNRISIYPVLEIPPRHIIEHAEVTIESTRYRDQLQTSSAARDVEVAIDAAPVSETPNLPIKIFDSTRASPYAQRKSMKSTPASSTPTEHMVDEINIIEDHYSQGQSTSSGSIVSIDSLSMYTVIK